MTVTLHLPPHVEQEYLAEAQARGLPLDEFISGVLLSRTSGQQSPASAQPGLKRLNSEEWVTQFEAWVASHAGNSVVLPDEAMERESIYADRGL